MAFESHFDFVANGFKEYFPFAHIEFVPSAETFIKCDEGVNWALYRNVVLVFIAKHSHGILSQKAPLKSSFLFSGFSGSFSFFLFTKS